MEDTRIINRRLDNKDFAFVFKRKSGLEFVAPKIPFEQWPLGYRMFLGSVFRGLNDEARARADAEWLEENKHILEELVPYVPGRNDE